MCLYGRHALLLLFSVIKFEIQKEKGREKEKPWKFQTESHTHTHSFFTRLFSGRVCMCVVCVKERERNDDGVMDN